MKKTAFVLLLSIKCLMADAQLKIINHTGMDLIVAIGNIEADQHVAKGWVKIKDNENKDLLPQLVPHRAYYYYAISSTLSWVGNETFLVGASDFSTSWPKDKNKPGLQEKKFRRLNVGGGNETSCVLELKLNPANIIVAVPSNVPEGPVLAVPPM